MTTATTKRITLATFKAFIKKNRENLLIRVRSRFDGMEDGVRDVAPNGFSPALDCDRGFNRNTLGIAGVWLVCGSRDYFSHFETESFVGIEVSNCCGSFILAIYKQPKG